MAFGFLRRRASAASLPLAQFEPRNKKEAFRFEAWRKSMQDEYDSLILNGVWVLILLSHVLATGAKIISGKWVCHDR